MKIIPLEEKYIEDAAKFVSRRYQHPCEQEIHLPPRYSEVDSLLPLLQNILKVSGTGVAAGRGDRLVGFLTGW